MPIDLKSYERQQPRAALYLGELLRGKSWKVLSYDGGWFWIIEKVDVVVFEAMHRDKD